MGNRIFHYHFLRQVAEKTQISYFHPKFPDSVFFLSMERNAKPFFDFYRSIRITSKDILTFRGDEFLSFICQETRRGKHIVLSPPILGEVFFDYCFSDPNQFIKVRKRYQKGFGDVKNLFIIGIHFRGTDFPKWNPNAALKFGYYEEAISFCIEYFSDHEIAFAIFTDDQQYPAYLDTLRMLKSVHPTKIFYGDTNSLPIYDFYMMTQCDVLISSPSTFAIFAGCLGKKKKIIHNNAWLEYSIDRNDKFWVQLFKTQNPYYSLWKAF